MFLRAAVVFALLSMPMPAVAQQQTLADIRQQLSLLFVDVQRLKRELATTAGAQSAAIGVTPLDRLNAIEAELQRLTANTEEMEFRIAQITRVAENRLGDLNFRLCELEEGCDIGMLVEEPLAGLQAGAAPPPPEPPADSGPALAIGEEADFDALNAALAEGDFEGAALIGTAFLTSYPESPLTPSVHFLRGLALEQLGRLTDSARAFLEAFSSAPEGPQAPEALFKLGQLLGFIGQTQDACLTLAEVDVRFAGDPFVARATEEMQLLGCQ